MMSTLPKPNEAFDWVQAPGGPALVCLPLEPVAAHIFTTRSWPLGSLLSADGLLAWDDVAKALEVDGEHLVRVHQVHGSAVLPVHRQRAARPRFGSRSPARTDADIIVSDDSAQALAIQTADCVPLLVADRRTGASAAAHAGWRGLAARVPEVAVRCLVRAFGSRSSDLLAAIGPSIGACCYEIGADVRARFEAAGFGRAEQVRWFMSEPRPSATNRSMPGLPTERRADHWFFDSWTAARDQLESAGVPTDQIYVAELCTASHPQVLCSYRRDGDGAGRTAAAIRSAPLRPLPRWPADRHER